MHTLLVADDESDASTLVRVGQLVVNLRTRVVTVSGFRIRLSWKEHQILDLLARKRGTIVTKDMLFFHLYDGANEPAPEIIGVFICKLRKKITALAGVNDYIQTIRGKGYMLCNPATAR